MAGMAPRSYLFVNKSIASPMSHNVAGGPSQNGLIPQTTRKVGKLIMNDIQFIELNSDIAPVPAVKPRRRASRAKAAKAPVAPKYDIMDFPVHTVHTYADHLYDITDFSVNAMHVTPEAPKYDITDFPVHTVLTYADHLFSTRFARKVTNETKPVKVAKPRKGDTIYIVDESGEYIDSGTITAKVSTSYATTRMDSSGRSRLIVWENLKKVAPGMWTKVEQY